MPKSSKNVKPSSSASPPPPLTGGQQLKILLLLGFKQRGGVQAVGAMLFAMAAVCAVVNEPHIALPFGRQPVFLDSPFNQKSYTRRVVNGDAGGTGQTITAAAAKTAGKLRFVFFNDAFQNVVQQRRLFFV